MLEYNQSPWNAVEKFVYGVFPFSTLPPAQLDFEESYAIFQIREMSSIDLLVAGYGFLLPYYVPEAEKFEIFYRHPDLPLYLLYCHDSNATSARANRYQHYGDAQMEYPPTWGLMSQVRIVPPELIQVVDAYYVVLEEQKVVERERRYERERLQKERRPRVFKRTRE